jgi:uroporphyrinogen-III synthase
MRRVVVLRPEPGASETMAKARALDLDAVSIPLFAIEAVTWEMPEGPFDGVLLTSANAVWRAGPDLQELRDLPAYAVGDATAQAARDAGFDVAAIGDEGVERLLGSVDPDLRLIHPCGEDRKQVPAARPTVTPIVVYRAQAIAAPDVSTLGGGVALVHSPRAGARLAELVEARSDIAVAAISTVAASAVGAGWAIVEAADRPTDEALLALAARLCNKPAP